MFKNSAPTKFYKIFKTINYKTIFNKIQQEIHPTISLLIIITNLPQIS